MKSDFYFMKLKATSVSSKLYSDKHYVQKAPVDPDLRKSLRTLVETNRTRSPKVKSMRYSQNDESENLNISEPSP